MNELKSQTANAQESEWKFKLHWIQRLSMHIFN